MAHNLRGFNVHSLQWSSDGRALVGAGGNEKGDWGAIRIDVATGETTTLAPGAGRGLLYPMPTPDGKALLYKLTGGLFRRDLQSGVEQELYATPDRAQWLTLSPDGQQLAFVESKTAESTLKLVPAAGGETREVARIKGSASTVAWTPDGKHLLFQQAAQLWRVSSAGGEPQKVALTMKGGLGHLRVHPDGRQIAFSAHPQPDKIEVWALENFLPPLKELAAMCGPDWAKFSP